MKIVVIQKPVIKAREGVNPFHGQPTIFNVTI